MIDMTFFVCLINLMFYLNKIIMKDLLFKKSLLVPFLLMFALFFSSCDKDKDEQNGDKSLEVTVNFTGSKKPKAGDVLNVVVIYTKISELDLDNYDGPDFYLDVPLTQSDIDNGVTVSLDMIDLTKPEIYVGALVDMDDELGPSPGDLLEFYDNVCFMDALMGVTQPANCHGKNSVVINLDKVVALPSLDVTVNFTGTVIPEPGDELHVVLVYSPFLEVDMENDGPDDMLTHTLDANDITNGKTLTFTNINPFADEIYVAAFVDTDDNGPGEGELLECYKDLSAYEILSGEKDATNVAGETAITIDLDKVGLGRSLDVTVNFTGTTKPLPGQKLYVSLFYSPLTEFDTEHGSEPDIMQSHILTANDITNGKTLTLSDIDPSATEAYVGAFVDTGDDGPGEGELIECYKDVDFVDAVFGEAEATNVIMETAITIDLDMVLEMP